MNIICTLYISSKKLGTLVSIPKENSNINDIKKELTTYKSNSLLPEASVRFLSSDHIVIMTDIGTGTRVDLQLVADKTVDSSLEKLSSNEHIIISDKNIFYKGKVYQSFAELSDICKYKAIPYVKMDDIIDYDPNEEMTEIDDLFIEQGYVKELRDALYILIPPGLKAIASKHNILDFLIKKADGIGSKKVTFISYSGRITVISDTIDIEGRYAHLSSVPKFTGEFKDVPYVYTMELLVKKYDIYQNRLKAYSVEKVSSICTAMRSLSDKLMKVENQFRAYGVYDDVVAILNKVREMGISE